MHKKGPPVGGSEVFTSDGGLTLPAEGAGAFTFATTRKWELGEAIREGQRIDRAVSTACTLAAALGATAPSAAV